MYQTYLESVRETATRLAAPGTVAQIEVLAELLCDTFTSGNKVLLAGNGGSAADCQHIAGELVVRFRRTRPALPAIAMTVDTSVMTACLNDFGPEPVFSRQVEALGREGDLLWVFSTSGNSNNILNACAAAKTMGLRILGFSGGTGGKLAGCVDHLFLSPSDVTSHIQECHIAVGHMLCLAVEERLFPDKE